MENYYVEGYSTGIVEFKGTHKECLEFIIKHEFYIKSFFNYTFYVF